MKQFNHSGKLGDLIYALPTVRALGGGALYLHPSPELGFTLQAARSALSLLSRQPFIVDVQIWDGRPVDHDLDCWRAQPFAASTNIADAHLKAFGLPLLERDRTWLIAKKGASKCRDVIFARSLLHPGPKGLYELAFELCRDLTTGFVGSKEDHETFEREVGSIEHVATKDLDALASAIASSKLFIGNQSCPFAICEGLKVPAILAVCEDAPNCMFDRPELLCVRDKSQFADVVRVIRSLHNGVLEFPSDPARRGVLRRSPFLVGQIPELNARWRVDAVCEDLAATRPLERRLIGSDDAATFLLHSRLSDGLVANEDQFRELAHANLYRMVSSCPTSAAARRIPAQVGPCAGQLPPASGESVSTIMLTYNSAATVEAAVESALAELEEPDELIIVDNGSADSTTAILQRYAAKRGVTLIENHENLGYSAGMNIGIRASRGSHLLLLNPDTISYRGLFKGLKERLTDPQVGAVGSTCDHITGDQFCDYHLPNNHKRLSRSELHQVLQSLNSGRSMETRLLMGVCLMLRREVLNHVGLLDEELFFGADDLELCWRLRSHGYRLLVALDQFVSHVGRVSADSLPKPELEQMMATSDSVLRRKLLAVYGPGPLPTSSELWGSDIFKVGLTENNKPSIRY